MEEVDTTNSNVQTSNVRRSFILGNSPGKDNKRRKNFLQIFQKRKRSQLGMQRCQHLDFKKKKKKGEELFFTLLFNLKAPNAMKLL